MHLRFGFCSLPFACGRVLVGDGEKGDEDFAVLALPLTDVVADVEEGYLD